MVIWGLKNEEYFILTSSYCDANAIADERVPPFNSAPISPVVVKTQPSGNLYVNFSFFIIQFLKSF